MAFFSSKPNNIGTSQIADGAIVNADINASAGIVYSKLALTNSIVSGDIVSLALAKLLNAGGASGDIIYWDGNNWVRLAKGSDAQVLKLASGLPSWASASSDIALNASFTATNGATSIGGTVTAKRFLLVYFELVLQTSSATFSLRFNGDATGSYAYSSIDETGLGGDTTADTSILIQGGASGERLSGFIIIMNPASSVVKSAQVFSRDALDASVAPDGEITMAVWNNTSADITDITLTRTSGTGTLTVNSRVRVFGFD